MQIKHSPRDFRVSELLDYKADPAGEFYVHLLRKVKMDTQDALSLISRLGRVPREDIAFAGLKDRQGETEQWISIRGRRVELQEPGLNLVFKGRTAQPIHSKQSRGNRFHVVLRGLSPATARSIQTALPNLAKRGYVNYFDDQRFGCLRHGQGFPMRDVLAGRYEKALQRLIARPSPVAEGGDTKLKTILKERWGDWEVCARIARGPVYQPVLRHLVRKPSDFAGAIQQLNTRTRLIQSFAYQSYIWNRAVSSLLDELVPSKSQIHLESLMGALTSFRAPSDELAGVVGQLATPLYAPDGEGGDPRFQSEVLRWLHSEQLTPEKCRRNTLPGMVWREEPRELLVLPQNVYCNRPEDDGRLRGVKKVEIAFSLPRGVYATMLIKHLIAEVGGARGGSGVSSAPRENRSSRRGAGHE